MQLLGNADAAACKNVFAALPDGVSSEAKDSVLWLHHLDGLG